MGKCRFAAIGQQHDCPRGFWEGSPKCLLWQTQIPAAYPRDQNSSRRCWILATVVLRSHCSMFDVGCSVFDVRCLDLSILSFLDFSFYRNNQSTSCFHLIPNLWFTPK